MVRAISLFFVNLLNRWMPDAFVVAVALSMLTFALAVGVAGQSPSDAVVAWGDSIWDLLSFTNQVVLTLLFGHALAHTEPVHRALGRVAGLVTSAKAAYVLASFVTGICALLSWGLSLIVGGIIARAIGENCEKNGITIHYPLLVAASYSGFVLFHQGISGTIPLTIATPDHFLEDLIGLIPMSETIFAPWCLAVAVATLATLPFVMAKLRPDDADCQSLANSGASRPAEDLSEIPEKPTDDTPASRMEHWRPFNWILLAAGFYFLFVHFVDRGQGLNLNILNMAFLLLAVGLSRSLIHFMTLINNAARIVGPYLLQYPFYAGIAGMMLTSGLAQMLVDFFISVSSAQTLPFSAYASAAILNIFIPSGGGQWAVQGPIMMDAAVALGADLPITAMAVAFGDQLTNLIQPLVIVPVLAIAGLHIRQVMGYMVMAVGWCSMLFLAGLALAVFG